MLSPASFEILRGAQLENLTRDMFPDSVLDSFSPQDVLPTQEQFLSLQDRCSIYPFKVYIKENRCVFFCTEEFDNRLALLFWYTLNHVCTPARWRCVPWRIAVLIMKRSLLVKNHWYHRTCFKIGNAFYLTKKSFTFGQRTVHPGTIHLIQTGKHPLSVFLLENDRGRVRTQLFPDSEEHLYRRFILESNQIYSILSGSVYILYTMGNSFFSIHLLQEHVTLPFEQVTPIQIHE